MFLHSEDKLTVRGGEDERIVSILIVSTQFIFLQIFI